MGRALNFSVVYEKTILENLQRSVSKNEIYTANVLFFLTYFYGIRLFVQLLLFLLMKIFTLCTKNSKI